MQLAHLLTRQAQTNPQREAVFFGAQLWATYAQWACRSAGLAQHMRQAGLQRGDRVALVLPQRFETAAAYIAEAGALGSGASRVLH